VAASPQMTQASFRRGEGSVDSSGDRRDNGHGRSRLAGEQGEERPEDGGVADAELKRSLFGYLRLGVATDTLMDQLRGAVDQL
jgi:hypothetical protein